MNACCTLCLQHSHDETYTIWTHRGKTRPVVLTNNHLPNFHASALLNQIGQHIDLLLFVQSNTVTTSMNLSHFGSFKKRCLNFSVHFRSLSAYFLTAYSPSSYVFYPVTASLTGNWGQCLFFTAAVKCVGSRDRKTGVGVRLECCETRYKYELHSTPFFYTAWTNKTVWPWIVKRIIWTQLVDLWGQINLGLFVFCCFVVFLCTILCK